MIVQEYAVFHPCIGCSGGLHGATAGIPWWSHAFAVQRYRVTNEKRRRGRAFRGRLEGNSGELRDICCPIREFSKYWDEAHLSARTWHLGSKVGFRYHSAGGGNGEPHPWEGEEYHSVFELQAAVVALCAASEGLTEGT